MGSWFSCALTHSLNFIYCEDMALHSHLIDASNGSLLAASLSLHHCQLCRLLSTRATMSVFKRLCTYKHVSNTCINNSLSTYTMHVTCSNPCEMSLQHTCHCDKLSQNKMKSDLQLTTKADVSSTAHWLSPARHAAEPKTNAPDIALLVRASSV